MVINTEFDGLISDDIALEDAPNKEAVVKALGESENIYKAYLYMKRMFGSSPVMPVEHDFTSSDGQTDFFIPGVQSPYVVVFTEGVKEKSSSYTVLVDTSGTTVRFASPKQEGRWVNILTFAA